jgi:hypothetical protein
MSGLLVAEESRGRRALRKLVVAGGRPVDGRDEDKVG